MSSPSHPPHTSHMVQKEDSQECFYQLQALIHIPNLPLHPLKAPIPTPTPTPRISLRFLPTIIWKKKEKQKQFKVLVLSPRGSMRWDTDGQGLLPLQPAPEPPPDPWLQKQGGAGASTGPRGAASQDLAEPRAASFNLATVDEHRRRKRKHCQVIRDKILSSIPVSTPSRFHTQQSLGLPGAYLNPIHRVVEKKKRELQSYLIYQTKCSLIFLKTPMKTKKKNSLDKIKITGVLKRW